MFKDYVYTAVDAKGKKCRGTIQAESRDTALLALKKQGLFATSMDDGDIPSVPAETEGFQALFDFFGFTFVNTKAMAVYTRVFAGLLNAGIDWAECFRILHEETENRRLRKISIDIADEIGKGSDVTTELSKYPNVFTRVYVSMISAGESTGRLDEILNRLADMYEEEHELRTSVMSKLYFPIIYLVVGLLLIGGVIFILPMYITTAYVVFPPALLFRVVVFWGTIAALVLLGRTKPGYRIFRTFISFIPPFNGVLRKMSLARFCRLLSAMYSSGVGILTGLDIAGETLMEPDLVAGVKYIKNEINSGNDLASALKKSNVFPRSLRSMVRTGEVAGDIEGMLDKAADYYELEIRSRTNLLGVVFTMLVMLLVLGTLAIFIITAWSGYYTFVESYM